MNREFTVFYISLTLIVGVLCQSELDQSSINLNNSILNQSNSIHTVDYIESNSSYWTSLNNTFNTLANTSSFNSTIIAPNISQLNMSDNFHHITNGNASFVVQQNNKTNPIPFTENNTSYQNNTGFTINGSTSIQASTGSQQANLAYGEVRGGTQIFGQQLIANDGSIDPNCRQFLNGICHQCSFRYYVGNQGRCIPVHPLCKSNNNYGECTQCYLGYMLESGRCIIGQVTDMNCKKFNVNICTDCYQGYFIDPINGICKRVNPLCKTSNMLTGACLSCYNGYSLNQQQGSCKMSIIDSNCKQLRSDGICGMCSPYYYVNNGICKMVNPLCKTYNFNDGSCTSCYNGYIVNGSRCIVGTSMDSNCKTYEQNYCTSCYYGYFIFNGKCMTANPLCKSFDSNGGCTSCYRGYDLFYPNCLINVTKDQNCKNFDNNNPNICIECYMGYIVINGICTVQNPICKTVDGSNNCLTCWQGYVLSNSNCIVDQQPTINFYQDPYCASFTNGICTGCVSGFFINSSTKICTQVDPLCRSNDINGNCLSCYVGYNLINSKCIIAANVNIQNCNIISDQGLCIDCLDGYFLSGSYCKKVPIQCLTYNKINGQCLSCIQKHYLQNGTCVYPGIFDDNCIWYESAYCSRCKIGYYLTNYSCKQIDPNCDQFNYNTRVCQICHQNKIALGPDCF